MSKARQLADLGNQIDDGAITGTNMVINGAMTVAQRGVSSTFDGYTTVDRFGADINNGAVTHSQETLTSGDPYDEGFRKFFRQTNTTSSSSSSDRRRFYQEIEAQNIAGSGWNYASSSSYITLSFWVRTSVAGDYYFGFRNFDGTSQGYVFQETLTANTWTKVTKSVSGNSNITIDNDTGSGLAVIFHQSNGTDFTGGSSVDVWHDYNNSERTPDDTNGWCGTTGATYDVTGVCLNVGDSAIDFPHESYGDTLAKCQRYYEEYVSGWAGDGGNQQVSFRVEKRSSPTVTVTQGSAAYLRTGGFRWDRAGDSTSEGYEADAEL